MGAIKKTAQKENKSVERRKRMVAKARESAALIGEIVPASHILNSGANIDPFFADKVQAIVNKKVSGRQSSITPEMFAHCVELIADGTPVIEACKAAGFDQASYYRLKRNQPALHGVTSSAHEVGLASRVESSLLELKDLRLQEFESHKEAGVAIRHKEASYRATMDYASRIDQTWSAKQQNVNLNVNTNVTEADVSRWFNG